MVHRITQFKTIGVAAMDAGSLREHSELIEAADAVLSEPRSAAGRCRYQYHPGLERRQWRRQ